MSFGINRVDFLSFCNIRCLALVLSTCDVDRHCELQLGILNRVIVMSSDKFSFAELHILCTTIEYIFYVWRLLLSKDCILILCTAFEHCSFLLPIIFIKPKLKYTNLVDLEGSCRMCVTISVCDCDSSCLNLVWSFIWCSALSNPFFALILCSSLPVFCLPPPKFASSHIHTQYVSQ